jgi:hypothetical protein
MAGNAGGVNCLSLTILPYYVPPSIPQNDAIAQAAAPRSLVARP